MEKNAAGTVTKTTVYYPFGETRFSTGTLYTDKLFTGQRSFTDIGLYHYGARFYSPRLGRFISPDTIVPGYANPQALNRYSYVFSNPLRYTDPSGNIPIDCLGGDGYCKPKPPPCTTCGGGNGGGGGGGGGTGGGESGGGVTLPSNCPSGPGIPIICTTASSSGAMQQQTANNCTITPTGWQCDLYVTGPALVATNLLLDVAQAAALGLWTLAGAVVGAVLGFVAGEAVVPAGGGVPGVVIGGILGGVIGAVGGWWDQSAIQGMQDEFNGAAYTNNPVTVSYSSTQTYPGVEVNGHDDGSFTVVNSPVAFVTLELIMAATTGQLILP